MGVDHASDAGQQFFETDGIQVDAASHELHALRGMGAGPVDITLLRWSQPDPRAWSNLGRAVGREDTTDWASLQIALGAYLQDEAASVASTTDDPEMRALLERIATRALR